MSRFLTKNTDGTFNIEIESMNFCKWKINEVCCNDKCNYLGDYLYPSSICENRETCFYFEEEDGTI